MAQPIFEKNPRSSHVKVSRLQSLVSAAKVGKHALDGLGRVPKADRGRRLGGQRGQGVAEHGKLRQVRHERGVGGVEFDAVDDAGFFAFVARKFGGVVSL